MTDRELLELAAKAAGIRIDYSEVGGGGQGNTGFDVLGNAVLDWHTGKTWNPLTDDGDALRLAVRLGIDINSDSEVFCLAVVPLNRECVDISEPYGDDPFAATRRAIVRTAAEVQLRRENSK